MNTKSIEKKTKINNSKIKIEKAKIHILLSQYWKTNNLMVHQKLFRILI